MLIIKHLLLPQIFGCQPKTGLNSEYEGERSYVSLYGFTEILPGRITTDRVVSSDGLNFIDFLNNAARIGDANTYIDFNTKKDRKLKIKGTIVQSESGDENFIGVFRGVYNPTYTYYQGDEVTYTANGNTSTYRYINSTPSRGNIPTNASYWQVIAQGAKGDKGDTGNTGATGSTGDYYEYRYAINGSRTSPPALSASSVAPSGWSTTMPSVGSLQYLWCTVAKKSAAGSLLVNWSTPTRVTGYDGKDGAAGAKGDTGPTMVFRGVYSSAATYYGTSKRVDCVEYNNTYYVARVDAGNGFSNKVPTDTNFWNDFGAQFESVATNLLLAENASVGNWWHSMGKIVSTLTDGNKITLDASMAEILIESKRISGDYTSGGEWSSFSYPSLWKQYEQSNNNSQEDGYEYIYYRTTTNSCPVTPTGKNEPGYIPSGWTYYSQGVNSTYRYEWMSRRYQKGLHSTIKLNAQNGLVEARNDMGVSYLTPGGIFSNWANTDAVSAVLGTTRKASIVGLGGGI